jgi:hypothetical protein
VHFTSVFVIAIGLRTLRGLRFSVFTVHRAMMFFCLVAMRDSAKSLVV